MAKKAFEIRLKNMNHPSGHRNVDIGLKKYIAVTINWRHFRLSNEELEIAETDPYITIIEKKKPVQMDLEFKAEPKLEPEKVPIKNKKKKPAKKKSKR